MRKLIWFALITLTVSIAAYTQGLENGFKVGYDTAMADTVLGLENPDEYVKGQVNGSSSRNDRTSDR